MSFSLVARGLHAPLDPVEGGASITDCKRLQSIITQPSIKFNHESCNRALIQVRGAESSAHGYSSSCTDRESVLRRRRNAYALPATARSPRPPSIGAESGLDGKPGCACARSWLAKRRIPVRMSVVNSVFMAVQWEDATVGQNQRRVWSFRSTCGRRRFNA